MHGTNHVMGCFQRDDKGRGPSILTFRSVWSFYANALWRGSTCISTVATRNTSNHNDHSIFAWHAELGFGGNVLADDPSRFWNCHNTVRMHTKEYRETIKQMIPKHQHQLSSTYELGTSS